MNPSAGDQFLWSTIAVLLLACVFVWHTLTAYPAVARVDHANLFFENLVTLLPALDMFLVRNLRVDNLNIYRLMVIGQVALTFSMVTDVIKELVDMPDACNMLFEGILRLWALLFWCGACAAGSFTTRP